MTVLTLKRTCLACLNHLHTRCWGWLAEIGLGTSPQCPCGCRDEHGELTEAALLDMAKCQPEALARHIRFHAAMKRSSLVLHQTAGARGRWSSP